PLAAAMTLAPSVSRMNTPPEPAAAVIVPAVVRIFAAGVPIPLALALGVVRSTVPAPTFSKVAAVWVMEPPVVLPPVFVATVSVPPDPVVMLRKAAAPVPPAAALTLTPTAFAVALVVVIALPGLDRKSCAQVPSVV